MRDPHIIIGAFIEKYERDHGQKLKLVAIPKTHGGFRASVEGKQYYASAVGVSLDACLQNLAKEVDTAKHVVVQS